MIADLVRSLFVDMTIVLVPLTIAMLCYLWLRQRENKAMLTAVRSVGQYFSDYVPVHAPRIIHDYFDSDLFLGDPGNVDRVIRWFAEELETQRHLDVKVDRLAFVEKREGPVGALTLKDLLSRETRLPAAILRPRRRGPAPRIKGLSRNRKPLMRFDEDGIQEHVAIVSDVGTTGTTVLEAVGMIESAGGRVDVAFVLYDRNEGAADALRARGVRLVAMARPMEQSATNAAEPNPVVQ